MCLQFFKYMFSYVGVVFLCTVWCVLLVVGVIAIALVFKYVNIYWPT